MAYVNVVTFLSFEEGKEFSEIEEEEKTPLYPKKPGFDNKKDTLLIVSG